MPAMAPPERAATTPGDALNLLLEGNRRWVDGNLAHPNRSLERRAVLSNGQSPFATVFSCIDSRVPAEIVFDCGIGDLAVVRTGAHVLDGAVLASLAFAVQKLGTPLLLVLGHEQCGAVTAALAALDADGPADAGQDPIVEALRPAYEAREGHELEAMIRAHTRLTVDRLTALLPHDTDGLRVLGGYYSFDTGAVSILD
jgi:carbonic anhydrase